MAIRPLDQTPDFCLSFPQEPSPLHHKKGGVDQLVCQRPGSGQVIGEAELVGPGLDDALRNEFFRLLNKRGLAARHED